MSSGGDGNYPRPHAPRKYDSDVLHMRHRDGDSPRSRTGGTDSPRGRSPFGSAAEGPSSSGSAQSDREREEARRREFEKGQKKEVYAPLDPRLLVSGIEAVGNNLFGFFQQTFTIPFANLPQWMDDREALRRHIFALDGEMKSLKDQLLNAHNAVEATKAERAKSAAETMKHWRQHRREVEKLKEDQAELIAGLQDLRSQSEIREAQHAQELRQAREATALAKREVVELKIRLAEAQQQIAGLEAKAARLEGRDQSGDDEAGQAPAGAEAAEKAGHDLD